MTGKCLDQHKSLTYFAVHRIPITEVLGEFLTHDFHSVVDDVRSSPKTGGKLKINKVVFGVFQWTNVMKSHGSFCSCF